MRRDKAATGTVDALTVGTHPLTQLVQTFNGLGGQAAVGTWSHIDEQVTVAPCGLDHRADDIVTALVVLVGDAVAPSVVHRHTGLQRQLADAVLTRVTRRVLTGHVLLKNLDILARERHLVVVVTDETCGLQAVDEGILLVELPIEGHGVGVMFPLAVKPDGTDGSVVGQQLGQLVVHELVVLAPVGGCWIVGHLFLVTPQGVVQTVPIQMGIVEMQLDAVTLASVGEFLEHIALEGGGIDNVVVGDCALEHRESVVMARGDGDVAGARILDGSHPLVGVETRRIETGRQLGILIAVDTLVEHDPLAVGKHGIDTPVDKDTELVVLEFLAGAEVLLAGSVHGLLG